MFPDRQFDADLIAEYNRQTRFEFERIRDFLILHYHANERDDSPFWRACAAMDVPDALKSKMALYRDSGRVYREHEELFAEVGWLQVMHGQRLAPRTHHPLADAPKESDLSDFFENIRTLVDRAVATMPSHKDYIARHCAAS